MQQQEVQDSDDFIRDEANSGPKEGQIRLVNGREESEVIGERVKNFSVWFEKYLCISSFQVWLQEINLGGNHLESQLANELTFYLGINKTNLSI